MAQNIASLQSEKQIAGQNRAGVDPRTEARSRWLWVAFILCFFGLQALLWTSALSMVRKHPIRPIDTQQTENRNPSDPAPVNSGKETRN